MKIRLMLVDDHRMFREALRIPLAAEADFEVVAEAGTGQELLAAIHSVMPDILVLDIALPDMTGIEVARRIHARYPAVLILALSGYTESMFVDEMRKAGARGYIVKSAGGDELIRGIRAIYSGLMYLSPEVTGGTLPHVNEEGEKPSKTILGTREQEVLRLVALGLNSGNIATKLGISQETVKVHRRNIKRKLGITSTAELTHYAIRNGLQVL